MLRRICLISWFTDIRNFSVFSLLNTKSLGRNQNHWSTIGDPISLKTHERLVGDPQILVGARPRDLNWKPHIFVGDPHIFVGDSQIIIGDPICSLEISHSFIEDPMFSLKTPYFHWDPQIFIRDLTFSQIFVRGGSLMNI